MERIDLHVHSNCSDGTDSPKELVNKALSMNLKAFALTDHDTTKGLEEAFLEGKNKDIEIVAGVELSTEYYNKDVHILGLYINQYSEEFSKFIEISQKTRVVRNEKMCANLQNEGIDITFEKLCERFPGAQITRAHYAKYLFEKGYVKSMAEGFERYVGDHCKAFVPREKISPVEAVKLIKAAGGVPVLAHPILYRLSDDNLEKLVASLKEAGLEGIETVYSTYAPSEERRIRALAAKYDLCMTGGSDYHGIHKKDIELAVGRGSLFVPDEFLANLKERYLKNYGTANKAAMFFDMDGTLLNNQKEISAKTMQALDEAIDKGDIFIISTGRPVISINKVINRLKLSDKVKYISAFNGGLVYDCTNKEVIYKDVLSHDIAKLAVEVAKTLKLHYHTYSDDAVICEKETEEMKYYSDYVKVPYKVVTDILAEVEHPYKVIIMDIYDKNKLLEAKRILEEKIGDKVQCLFSCDYFLEIMPITSGKGNALKILCKSLGIDIKDSYAFADEENDISMLQAAGHGVALLNANPNAKRSADYITFRDNNNDGLYEFINKIKN